MLLQRDAALPWEHPALPDLLHSSTKAFLQQKTPELHQQKVLPVPYRHSLDCNSCLPSANTFWCLEPIKSDCRSDKEGIFNNEIVINPDRQAALRITFQLLVVGGQIIPFHHISHCSAYLLGTFSHETL